LIKKYRRRSRGVRRFRSARGGGGGNGGGKGQGIGAGGENGVSNKNSINLLEGRKALPQRSHLHHDVVLPCGALEIEGRGTLVEE